MSLSVIQSKICDYYNENNFQLCGEKLKEQIKKVNQMKMYDDIYDNFILNNKIEDYNEDTVIPGL